jgi:hypothetical protein
MENRKMKMKTEVQEIERKPKKDKIANEAAK